MTHPFIHAGFGRITPFIVDAFFRPHRGALDRGRVRAGEPRLLAAINSDPRPRALAEVRVAMGAIPGARRPITVSPPSPPGRATAPCRASTAASLVALPN